MTKRILSSAFIVISLISGQVYADVIHKPLNRIQLQLVKEMWAKTTTARVSVNMAAVLNESGLANTHQSLQDKLKQISNAGEWHVTAFNRYKDASGLEKLNASAEARLPEKELPSLRARAEKISVPGQKFTIGNIEFKPSMADMQRTRADVRQAIYQQATAELARINKELGGGYYIHAINFMPDQPMPQPLQKQMQMRTMVMEAAPSSDAALVVSDKVTLNAVVVLAQNVAN